MTNYAVITAEEPQLMRQFHSVPEAVYAGDPQYCRQNPSAVTAGMAYVLSRDESVPLLVLKDSKPLARCIAGICRGAVDVPSPFGYIGWFEAHHDQVAVTQLLDAACSWFRARGITRIIGPMNGDTWHSYRFSSGPYEHRPFLMEPYNPSWYPELWESYGFVKAAAYYSKRIENGPALLSATEKFYNRIIGSGYRIRQFNKHSFSEEIQIIYELSCKIFCSNPLYTPISLASFEQLYSGAEALIDPELVCFMCDAGGREIGYIFTLPDYFEAVRLMKGNNGIGSKFKFLLNKKQAKALNVKTIGILPGKRGAGLSPALLHQVIRNWCRRGHTAFNYCLMHERNVSMKMDFGLGSVSRQYYIYEYSL